MRTAGAVFITVAVLVVAGFWLIPADVTVFGTSVSCGTPFANTSTNKRADNEFDQAVINDCQDRSRQRVVIGLVLGLIAAIAGMLMLRSADNMDDDAVVAAGGTIARAPQSSAGRWLGRIAVKVVALFVAVIVIVVFLAQL